MNKTWTLHVESLAKIKKADVILSDLMFFVGNNNSGKSYLMSLMWGMLTYGKELFPKTPSDAGSYKKCEDWLKENLNKEITFGKDEIDLYISWFNDLLVKRKKLLVKKIFNYDVDVEKIEIRDYHRESDFCIEWDETNERYSVGGNYVKFPSRNEVSREELLRMNAYICWNLLMEGIAAPLYTPTIKGRRNGEPIYMPASRTGFMLTYPQLVESALQVSFSADAEETENLLTQPYVDFLQLITKFDTKKVQKKYSSIIDFIEKNMTKGQLDVKKDGLPVIHYKPIGSDRELPLYVASSIVSEVSPILLLLKSNINFKTIIIEEPEAHLHPELQKQMARLLIKLANQGITVWVTTHSDTILQHVNNMIKLENNAKKKELLQDFKYETSDLINDKDIKMYQFEELNQNYTQLIELERTDYGFVVPTFNEAIERMVGEIQAFEEE